MTMLWNDFTACCAGMKEFAAVRQIINKTKNEMKINYIKVIPIQVDKKKN
jgi:hypothetical protein